MALHSFALQQAIFTALDGATINDADGNAITGVFDDVPENTAYPYVVIGEETTSDKSISNKTKDNFGKISRNQQCPCGSGKKFKHCCGKL